MRRLDLYIIRQILLQANLVALGLTFTIVLVQSMRLIDFIINRGLPLSKFIWYALLLAPRLFLFVLPFSVFLGVLICYRRYLADSELVILKATGFSNLRLIQPVLIVLSIFSLLGLGLSLWIVPYSLQFLHKEMRQNQTMFSTAILQPESFISLNQSVTVYAESRKGNILYNLIYDNQIDNKQGFTIFAKEGQIIEEEGSPKIIITNGTRQTINNGQLEYLAFERSIFELVTITKSNEQFLLDGDERTLPRLINPEPEARNNQYLAKEIFLSLHRALIIPFWILSLGLIAVSHLIRANFSRYGLAKPIALSCLWAAITQSINSALSISLTKQLWLLPLFYGVPLLIMILFFIFGSDLRGRYAPHGRS